MTAAMESSSASFKTLRGCLQQQDDGSFRANYREYRIGSHFQPVVSLTHGRVIGHEALMRAVDAGLQPIAPNQLLHHVEDDAGELMRLDRLARMLHIANGASTGSGWLFLNMHPRIFTNAHSNAQHGFLSIACDEFGINPGHIVIEILEHSMRDEVQFADAIRHIHEDGYLVALDDFGAGSSNFDRVWDLAPEIVKLDRSFALRSEHDPLVRRLLPRIVALLHETGAYVVLEGVENRTQAMIALDANVDFGQGYYFAMPQAAPLEIHSTIDRATRLWQNYDSEIAEQERRMNERLVPYRKAVADAAAKVAAGLSLADACAPFFSLQGAEFCYLLDDEGRQLGNNVWRPGYVIDRLGERFKPVVNIPGARWSRRGYFRSAMDNISSVQNTQPYLSSASANVCITISLAFRLQGKVCVLCGDVVWDQTPL
jgi:EAL domain-containing protein (putative c-di-GMP-specific phosphodiesterase class I)